MRRFHYHNCCMIRLTQLCILSILFALIGMASIGLAPALAVAVQFGAFAMALTFAWGGLYLSIQRVIGPVFGETAIARA